MMTYPTKKLGEVCDVFADGDWIETKDQSSSGIRLVQTGNIGRGVFIGKENSRSRFISEATFKRLNCTEVLPGDILISRLPDPVGRACIVPELETRMITAVDCTIIRPRTQEIQPEFLLQYLNSAEYFAQIDSLLTGTTRKRINRGNLGKIAIPVPTIAEQRKIVAKIEKSFAKIGEAARLRAESERLAEELLPAALHEIFTNLETDEVSVGSLSKMISGGTPSRAMSQYWQGDIPWVTSRELNDKFIETTKEHITENGLNKSNAKILPTGTLLIGMYDTGALKMSISRKQMTTNQAIIGLIPSDTFSSDFIYYQLTYLRSEILLTRQGIRQKNLNATKVKNIKIKLPPLAEQKNIVKKLDALAEKAHRLREAQAAQSANLKSLKQSVLHEAFVA